MAKFRRQTAGLHQAMMLICCGTISSNVASSDYYSRRQQLIRYLLCLVGTFTHSSRVPIDSLIIREVRCSAKLIGLFGNLKCSHLFNFVCLFVCLFSYVTVCFDLTVVKREKYFNKWTWEHILCGRFQTIARKCYFFLSGKNKLQILRLLAPVVHFPVFGTASIVHHVSNQRRDEK